MYGVRPGVWSNRIRLGLRGWQGGSGGSSGVNGTVRELL